MFDRKKKARIKDLHQQTTDAQAQLNSQKPKVNALSTYLTKRSNQNGFGLDFEYTLRPRGTR